MRNSIKQIIDLILDNEIAVIGKTINGKISYLRFGDFKNNEDEILKSIKASDEIDSEYIEFEENMNNEYSFNSLNDKFDGSEKSVSEDELIDVIEKLDNGKSIAVKKGFYFVNL